MAKRPESVSNQPVKIERKKKGSFLGRWFKRLIMLAVLVALGLGGWFKMSTHKWPWQDKAGYLAFSKQKLLLAKDKATEKAKQGKSWVENKIKQARKAQQPSGSTSTAKTDDKDQRGDATQYKRYMAEYHAGVVALDQGKDLYRRAKAPGHVAPDEDLTKALNSFRDAKGHFAKAKEVVPSDQARQALDSQIKDINAWIVDVEKQLER